MIHRHRRFLAASLAALALALPLTAGGQSPAEAIFREGLLMERAEGRLRDAIFRYERVVAEFPASRDVVAQALHQLALAYDKLGDQRAKLMWSRLATGTANPYTAEARNKVKTAQTAGSTGPFAARTLDPNYLAGSPDGRWVVYYKGGVERLYIRDLVTDNERLLLDVDGMVANPTWSPDSRHLAFYFGNAVQRVRDIRIVAVENGAVRSLGVGGFPLAWTARDELLFYQSGNLPGVDMFLTPVAGGQPRKVYSENVNDTCGWAISPDGGSLVACRAKRLVIRDLVSGAERAVTTGSGEERAPVLSRDGRLVAFKSNEDGKWAVYVAPLDNVPMSKPLRISTIDNAGELRPAGWWTEDGLLVVRQTLLERNVYRIDMDPTGHATDSPRRLTQDAPQNHSPSINSDGSRIAYLYRGVKGGIAVMDAGGLNERPLLESVSLLPLYWRSPDEILFHDFVDTSSTNGNIVSLDVRTGATDRIAKIAGDYWWFVPARREILYLYPSVLYQPGAELRAFSLADGKDRVVAKIDFLAPALAVSPDGRRIAYTVAPSTSGQGAGFNHFWISRTMCELALMSIDGTREKALAPPSPSCRMAAAWSPDGTLLLLNTPEGPMVMNVETRGSWRVHADAAGSSWAAGSWAPDGSFITLTRSEGRNELRAWEGVTAEAVSMLLANR